MSKGNYLDVEVAIVTASFFLQMVFVFGYFADQLKAEAFKMNESIYCSEWYRFPPKIQMFMIYVMRRAQKPYLLQGLSLTNCSLQSFMDVNI